MATTRTDRDLHRGRRAAARVRIDGGSAIAAAYAHIEATFSSAMPHSMVKDRVATLTEGAAHLKAWIRYRGLIERHPIKNLDAAILLIEQMHRAELETRAAAVRNWGHCSRPRLTLTILQEVRLILRVLRRYAPTRFADFIMEIQSSDLATPVWAGMTTDAAE
jgi:hypothetical protein